AELDALVKSGQEAAAPIGIAAAGAFLAGGKDDETGQVLRLAAQAVGDPRADAGPAKDLRPGVHHDLARSVVERIRDHRADDGDIIDYLSQVREQLRQFRAALAVSGKLELRAEELGAGIDERGPVALDEIGRRQGTVELGQLRLVVE